MSVDYHSRSELSSSQIADFLADPVAWYHIHVVKDWPKPPPTPAMEFGTQIHSMIENGGPDSSFLVEIPPEVLSEQGHKRGKAWTEWSKAQRPDAVLYKRGEPVPLIRVWENLTANKHCVNWMAQECKEQEIFWTDLRHGIECRAKLDVDSDYPVPCIVDWKTAADISPRGFQSACYSMHYDIRLAFYRRGIRNHNHDNRPIICVAIENKGSYRVQPYQLSDAWIDAADERLSRTIEKMQAFDLEAELNQGILELDAPRWASFDNQYELETVG